MRQNTCFIIIAPKTNQYWGQFNNKLSVDVNNDYLINHQINNILHAYPKASIIVAGDTTGMSISRKKRVKYVDMQFDDTTNIGGILMNILFHIKATSILIINIGTIVNTSYIKDINISKTSMITSVHKNFKSKIGCVIEDGGIKSIFYDLNNNLCEMLYIHYRDISRFKQIIQNNVKKYMYLFEVVNLLIKHNIAVGLYKTNKNVLHLDDPEKLTNAKRMITIINKENNVSV